jgi:hypothetical protein
VFTGNEAGEVDIHASINSVSTRKRVLVLPVGTFVLHGQIREAGAPTGPVVGARVEATSTGGAHLITETDQWGRYYLYGISGEIRLRVAKDGYQPVIRIFDVADHKGYDVELPLLAPRADITGTYTMRLNAADDCSVGVGEGRLREEAHRVRTYGVEVRQDGPTLEVRAHGATLRDQYAFRPFGGRVEPGRIVLDFTWYDGEWPFLVDDFTPPGTLIVDGLASATRSGDRLTGTFSGHFRALDPGTIWAEPIAWCYSTRHQFALSR